MSANSHSLSAQVDPTNASEHLTHIRVTAWRKGEEGLDAPLVRLRIDVDGSGYQIMLTPNGASKLASQLSAASDYAESTGECAP